jgi:hypothetical protein
VRAALAVRRAADVEVAPALPAAQMPMKLAAVVVAGVSADLSQIRRHVRAS